MLLQLAFAVGLLLFLFLISRKVTAALHTVFFLLSRNNHISLGMLAFLLLPGTAIHEMAHLVMALLLRVRVGDITILPKREENGEIRAGAVRIAKTDPFRHTIIGIAPLIIGIPLVYLIGKAFLVDQAISFAIPKYASYAIALYLLFVISISMFSSKKDLEALLISGPIALLVGTALYIIGIRISLENMVLSRITTGVTELNVALVAAVLIDFCILWIAKGIVALLRPRHHHTTYRS